MAQWHSALSQRDLHNVSKSAQHWQQQLVHIVGKTILIQSVGTFESAAFAICQFINRFKLLIITDTLFFALYVHWFIEAIEHV